jgi:LAO/AO transport system kinase
VVIVESVGLGQSEVDIDAAVDMLLLLVPPGGGDSLQAAKKGIMEAADLVVVNKADGGLLETAKHTKADYSGAMQFIRQKSPDWRAKVLMASAQTGFQLDMVEEAIASFHSTMIANRGLWDKRSRQARHWMHEHFRRLVVAEAEAATGYKEHVQRITRDLEDGLLPPRVAANSLYASVKASSSQV